MRKGSAARRYLHLMRYAFQVGSSTGKEIKNTHIRPLHQAAKLGVQSRRGATGAHSIASKEAISIFNTSLSVGRPERRGKDQQLEYLIQRSRQNPLSRKPRAIYNKMPKDSSKPVPRSKTHSRVQFITTPTADTPGTALLLHFDDRRYLIGNIHEGLQRAGLQVGAKVFRAKDFFLTGKTEWRSNGGLMGMILTSADSNNARAASRAEVAKIKLERRVARSREEEQQENSKKSRKKNRQGADQTSVQDIEPQVEEEDPTITLHGGPNLSHTIATARSFIFRHGNPLKVDEYSGEDIPKGEVRDWEPTWQDEWVRVWSMAISPSTSEGSSRPVSPRKRSLGEYINGQIDAPAQPGDTSSPIPIPNVDEKQRNQKIRDFVVTEMFNSSWRYDNLVEKPLHEVVMPANLFTKDPKTKKLVKYTGPVPDGTTPVPNVKVLVRQPWPGALVDHLPPTKPSPIAMSYIFRNHPQRGKFRPEAAKALKVPSGPLWAALAKGNEVKSSDGKTITPDMVLQPGKEGSGIAVIDLPSEDYLQNLVQRPEWKAERVMNGVGAVVWLLGPGFAHNPVLREFIDSKSDIKHMISSVDTCPNYLVQTAAASAAIRHNQIDPARFPIPVHSNATALKLVESGDNEEHKPEHLLSAQRGLQIDLEPSFKITDQNIIPHLNTALVLQETPKQVLKLAQAAREDIKSKTAQVEAANQGLPSEDAEITSLGTGSASPSIFRNVSATLLRVPGHGSYLIDCGENTLGQLKRVFTESQLAEVFHDLKMIWISHLHADHHLGIASVVRAWYEEVHGKDSAKRSLPSRTEALSDPARFLEEGKKLFIVGHSHMMRWLEEYSSVEDFGYNQLVPCSTFSTNWQQPDRCNIDWNGINIGFNTAKDPNV